MATRVMLVVMLLVLICSVAMAQVIGDGVVPQVADPSTVPPTAAMQQQGVTNTAASADPATGNYSILVNGYIAAYARVSAYDNSINFGTLNPTSGAYGPLNTSSVSRWAFSQAGASTYALAGETGGLNPLYQAGNTSDCLNFDLAGIQIQTNARLDLAMLMGGYLTRVTDAGLPFAGVDTRRADGGFYQLRNQVKMVMHGKFLDYTSPADPAPDAAGTAFTSPTSGELAAYNTWTQWGSGADAIPNDGGWFEPDLSNDPWTGTASGPVPMAAQLPALTLVVERGQAQTTGPASAAEIWFTQRIIRRGLQDVAGNYMSNMSMLLTYREADGLYTPPAF